MVIDFRTSLLFVADVTVSRRFYEDLLGQTVSEDFGECVGFVGGFSIMQRDRVCQVVFGRPFDATKVGEHRVELYFETDDVDLLFAKLSEAGVPVVHAVREQPWGQRVFRVTDPDGAIVEFGEPMSTFILRFVNSGLSIEQVSKRCNTPVEKVRRFVDEAR